MRVLLLLLIFISCAKKETLPGKWSATLNIQETFVPFSFEISKDSKFLTLYNAKEKLRLTIQKRHNILYIPIRNYDSAITLLFDGRELKGTWEKFNRKQKYELSISAEKEKNVEELKLPTNFPKKWKISFKKKDGSLKDALLIFTKTHASVITQTGDYRFLRPVLKGDKLNLYGFDGAFSFNFDGVFKNNIYKGTMYSGLSWKQEFTAIPDNNFELKDANTITKLSKDSLNICLPSLSKGEVCLNKKSNKPKVIQIFGSWCPNCIDETMFIQEYRKKHNPKVDFFIVSFERAPNKKQALRLLTKTKGIYRIDYPILLAGFTRETKVSDIFKGIDNFASFPTTIYVDKKGNIRKVHSGFTGPATGQYFEAFSFEFDQFLKKLQAE